MRFNSASLLALSVFFLATGCHNKPPPTATTADVEAAQQEVAAEISKAKAEASKDVKSAAKTSGGNAREVTEAKTVGAYDVAMVQADGDHKIAAEKCLTLPRDQQQPCNAKADAYYESAKADAKAKRLAHKP